MIIATGVVACERSSSHSPLQMRRSEAVGLTPPSQTCQTGSVHRQRVERRRGRPEESCDLPMGHAGKLPMGHAGRDTRGPT